MTTHQSLTLSGYGAPLKVEHLPIPTADAGSAIIRVLATPIPPHYRYLTGSANSGFALSFPLTPGSGAVARIHSVGPDAVYLKPGDLVFFSVLISGRDDQDASILLGFHGGLTDASKKLMDGVWRNGTYAEYAKVPLETVFKLDENILIKQMGYAPAELASLNHALVAYGGLRDIDLKAGEKIIVAPSTGKFSGAGVAVALAMGAVVIAAGRNKGALEQVQEAFAYTGRLRIVQLTGDVSVDTQALITASGDPGGADAYLDLSPAAAAKSTHIAAAIGALRTRGRVSFMGGIYDTVEIPYIVVMYKSLRIQGKYMYDRQDVLGLIKLVEAGLLKVGSEGGLLKLEKFGLHDFEKALDTAEANPGWGQLTVLEP